MQLTEISTSEEAKSQEIMKEISRKFPRSENIEYSPLHPRKALIKYQKQLMKKVPTSGSSL